MNSSKQNSKLNLSKGMPEKLKYIFLQHKFGVPS